MLDPATRKYLRGIRTALDAYEKSGNPTYRFAAEARFVEFMEAARAAERVAHDEQNARAEATLAGLAKIAAGKGEG